MSRKKISTTIYVTPEQSDKLKLLHERTKVPVAVYIREGIDLVLRHYGHLLPGQLPLDGQGRLGVDMTPRPTATRYDQADDDADREADRALADDGAGADAPALQGHSAHASAKK